MLPHCNYSLVRAVHEERIRAAQRPVPEWIGIATPPERQRPADGVRQRVRSSFARALRRLAASVDPRASTVNAA
jgi:hypothetical protein